MALWGVDLDCLWRNCILDGEMVREDGSWRWGMRHSPTVRKFGYPRHHAPLEEFAERVDDGEESQTRNVVHHPQRAVLDGHGIVVQVAPWCLLERDADTAAKHTSGGATSVAVTKPDGDGHRRWVFSCVFPPIEKYGHFTVRLEDGGDVAMSAAVALDFVCMVRDAHSVTVTFDSFPGSACCFALAYSILFTRDCIFIFLRSQLCASFTTDLALCAHHLAGLVELRHPDQFEKAEGDEIPGALREVCMGPDEIDAILAPSLCHRTTNITATRTHAFYPGVAQGVPHSPLMNAYDSQEYKDRMRWAENKALVLE